MSGRPGTVFTRRSALGWTCQLFGGSFGASLLNVAPISATPTSMDTAIRSVIGSARALPGKVVIDLPPIVENGNAVPITVSVDSPMTEQAYVKEIHVFNEKNPQPHVINVQLTPRAGRAVISTRIRLADSQKIVALAHLNDGSFWTQAVDVIVTLAACIDQGP